MEFYLSTIDKKWAHDYLTDDFFKMVFENLNENILLYLAEKNGEFIAATLNFYKGDTLFGRYTVYDTLFAYGSYSMEDPQTGQGQAL